MAALKYKDESQQERIFGKVKEAARDFTDILSYWTNLRLRGMRVIVVSDGRDSYFLKTPFISTMEISVHAPLARLSPKLKFGINSEFRIAKPLFFVDW
ncbi:hypothetical protein Tco_0980562 [Tanacetum coccineum]